MKMEQKGDREKVTEKDLQKEAKVKKFFLLLKAYEQFVKFSLES